MSTYPMPKNRKLRRYCCRWLGKWSRAIKNVGLNYLCLSWFWHWSKQNNAVGLRSSIKIVAKGWLSGIFFDKTLGWYITMTSSKETAAVQINLSQSINNVLNYVNTNFDIERCS